MSNSAPRQLDMAEAILTRLLNVLPVGTHQLQVNVIGTPESMTPSTSITIRPNSGEERGPEDIDSDIHQMRQIHQLLVRALNSTGVMTVITTGAVGTTARVWGIEPTRISALTAIQAMQIVGNQHSSRDAEEL